MKLGKLCILTMAVFLAPAFCFAGLTSDINDAKKLLEIGNADRAAQILSDMNKKHPANADIRALLGIALVNMQKPNPNEAIKYLSTSLDEDKRNPQYPLGLCKAYRLLQKTDRALMYCKKAIKLKPESNLGYRETGLVYYGVQNTDKAVYYFKTASKKNPKDYLSLYYLGKTYSLQKKYSEALASLKEADFLAKSRQSKASAKDLALITSALGSLYERRGIKNIAIKYYREALTYYSSSTVGNNARAAIKRLSDSGPKKTPPAKPVALAAKPLEVKVSPVAAPKVNIPAKVKLSGQQKEELKLCIQKARDLYKEKDLDKQSSSIGNVLIFRPQMLMFA